MNFNSYKKYQMYNSFFDPTSQLISAVTVGDLEGVVRGLGRGANPNEGLYYAVVNNNYDIVTTLLAHPSVDVNINVNPFGLTPLHEAVINNYRDIVRLLLLHPDIDVNKTDFFGDTPLHFLTNIDLHNTQLMLDMGSDVFSRTIGGQTPFSMLISNLSNKTSLTAEDIAKMELLLSRGSDINTRDINGLIPLGTAMASDRNRSLIEFLIELGAE